MYLGGVEAGGTKMCCCVGNEKGQIIERCNIMTTNPSDTFDSIAEFFIDFCSKNKAEISGLGLGWFGPINIDTTSAGFGTIGRTPKPGWSGVNVISELKSRLECLNISHFGLTTDVNASLLGEAFIGQAKELKNAVYLTIGTGIGAGIMVNGRLAGGFSHPEFGHILIPRASGDTFAGACPSHGDCFEGLASGPSMEKRWKMKASELPDDHIGWIYEAQYISSAVLNIILTLCPQRIILGGGVMKHAGLLELIRELTTEKLADYMDLDAVGGISSLVAAESLGGDQGMIGCLYLAMSKEEF